MNNKIHYIQLLIDNWFSFNKYTIWQIESFEIIDNEINFICTYKTIKINFIEFIFRKDVIDIITYYLLNNGKHFKEIVLKKHIKQFLEKQLELIYNDKLDFLLFKILTWII